MASSLPPGIRYDQNSGIFIKSGSPGPGNPFGTYYFDPQSGQSWWINQEGQKQVATGDFANTVAAQFQGVQAPGDQSQQDQSIGSVGGRQLFRNSQGQTYYQSGGNRYALSPDQMDQMGLPSVAGYDQQGNPYYTPSKNPSQLTGQPQGALSSPIDSTGNWSSGFQDWLQQNAGKTITINGARTTVPKSTDPQFATWANQLAGDITKQHATVTDSGGANLAGGPQDVGMLKPISTVGRNPANPTAEATPEGAALGELQKTDPGTFNMIQQLQKYYGTEGKNMANPAQQNALDTYYQGQAQAINKGLDPTTTRQIQQDSRAAQLARGNALGPAQAVQEALTTGQAGINLRSQEAQNLGSYLNSRGQGVGSYLNSGTTPAAMGSRQLSDIINQSNASSGSTPFQSTYNPQNTFTYFNPQSGSQFAQGAQNWYNAANYQYLGSGAAGGGLSPGMSAGAGALSGAASGAMAGTTFGPYGTLAGAGIGALAGGLGGYMSNQNCWVARECLGTDNQKWKVFRDWMLEDSHPLFRYLYLTFGQRFARFIHNKPIIKKMIAKWMNKIVEKKLRSEVQYAR